MEKSPQNSTPETEQRKVILANPGTRLSFQTALGLEEASLLKAFVTSFYYKEGSFLSKLVSFLPQTSAAKLERELKRRYVHGLTQDRVITLPYQELIYALSNRLKVPAAGTRTILDWRNASLANLFSQTIKKHCPAAVICCDGWGVDAFKTCSQVGSLRILDQNTAHVTQAARILDEERELHPEFSDSIPEFPAEFLEKSSEEALLADYVIVPSTYVKESLAAIGVEASRIFEVPYGAVIERFSPAESRDPSKTRFLYVGNVSQRKGIKYLLEAFRALSLPDAELVLVGGIMGSGQGLVPYSDIFTHIPNVPHSEIHMQYQAADVFVFPALHEGSSISVFEAMACGLPVITTPNAGSVVRDGEEGYIVPIRESEALAEKMLLLHQDKNLRRSLGEKARRRAELFTLERYRKTLGEAVQGILSSASRNQ